MKRSSIALAVVVSIVLVVAIAIGGWQLKWWMRSETVNRNAQINQESFNRQNALIEQILDDIKDAETAGIPAGQRIAIVDQICDSAAKLTGTIQLSPNAQAFINQECPA